MRVRSLVAAWTVPANLRAHALSVRWSSRRAGCAVACGGVAFLFSYATLQLVHAAGLDPRVLRALSSIPLFGRAVAAGGLASLGAAAGAIGEARLARWLPHLLWLAGAIFFLAVVLLA